MLVDEHHDVAELEPSLSAGGSMVVQPATIGVAADGGGTDAENSTGFF